uniref:Macaca fascicularis brain cDNA clone: QmoA-10974, similar to human KIAA0355 (KIAA0355), mRNA, RefSeq: NM_014686.2 n=1 Tax=Macaca fascicularis TaxID=9541 RepID=I7GN32_MACFA|nr:unnamed protein product [Macaca fascicularis]
MGEKGVLHTFKPPDLVRSHCHEYSKGKVHLHDPVTCHEAPPPTLRITTGHEIWVGTQSQTISDMNTFQKKIYMQPTTT